MTTNCPHEEELLPLITELEHTLEGAHFSVAIKALLLLTTEVTARAFTALPAEQASIARQRLVSNFEDMLGAASVCLYKPDGETPQ